MQTKLKFFVYTVAACLTLSSLTGCLESGDAEEDQPSQEEPAPSDGSQSKAQLAGTFYGCSVFDSSAGSALNGKGYSRNLTLNSDGTYQYSVYFTDHTGCTVAWSPGGNNVATYSQSGTWATNGISSSITGTNVTFTPSSAQMVVYTPTASSIAEAIRTWANTCANGPGYASSGTSTEQKTFQPTSCGPYGSTLTLTTPPVMSSAVKNVLKKGTSFEAGGLSNVFTPGDTSYPTSFSSDYWRF